MSTTAPLQLTGTHMLFCTVLQHCPLRDKRQYLSLLHLYFQSLHLKVKPDMSFCNITATSYSF